MEWTKEQKERLDGLLNNYKIAIKLVNGMPIKRATTELYGDWPLAA